MRANSLPPRVTVAYTTTQALSRLKRWTTTR